MTFFLTQQYDAPKPSKLFWVCHYIGWSILGLIDFLTALLVGAKLAYALIAFFLLISINTIICLRLRNLIHGKSLVTKPFNKTWLILAFYSFALAFVSAGNYYIFTLPFRLFWPEPEVQILQVGQLTALLLTWLSLSAYIFIWGLIYVSVKYSNQLKIAKQASAELTLELRSAQLNTLMAQLNPHFLFNALNNIRGLILEDADRSREMITLLAEMLRYSLLSDKKEFETLENELNVVRAYIEIASIQYEERLQYVEEIDAKLLTCTIPPMLIQMLIENAVKYGIDQTSTGGEIKLSITPQDYKMIINVCNPGNLNNDNVESTGLGVKNIQKRLSLLYLDEASFSIRQEGNNVVATAVLPAEFSPLEPTDGALPS